MTEVDPFPVETEVENSYKNLKFNKRYVNIIDFYSFRHRILTLAIVNQRIVVDEIGDRSVSVEDGFDYFPQNECRYVIWDVDYSSDKYVSSSRMYFFTWCPHLAST